MKTLLIGYDLKKETTSTDYNAISKFLKENFNYWHCLDSTWLVRTELTPTQLRDLLLPSFDNNDVLLVIDVTGDAAAWRGFSQDCSDWLMSNL